MVLDWFGSYKNSGVVGEGDCIAVESEESLLINWGMGGEPMGEDI